VFCCCGQGFNSRAHAGRDQKGYSRGTRKLFQFTRPRGARRPSRGFPEPARCFNSRAHAGRDPCRRPSPTRRRVSIHAPTRGATIAARLCSEGDLFQFTRPRGARPQPCKMPALFTGFNSRAHAGRDGTCGRSAHTPAGFNSRAHAGRDTGLSRSTVSFILFQFTRPRGARPDDTPQKTAPASFNSRAHAGRDYRSPTEINRHVRFQFTRPRGARQDDCQTLDLIAEFQFTRPRGARQMAM